MANQIDVKVPRHRDFKDVAVIEVMVKPGETIAVDTGHASNPTRRRWRFPSAAGVVKEIKVKVDDKVSEGSVILAGPRQAVAASAAPRLSRPPSNRAAAPAASVPKAGSFAGKADTECEVPVLGAGPGGYSAAFRSADLGRRRCLSNVMPTLGGVCPMSAAFPRRLALLHTAATVDDEVRHLPDHGSVWRAEDRYRQAARLQGRRRQELTGGPPAWWRRRARSKSSPASGWFLDAHHLEVEANGEEDHPLRQGDHRRWQPVGEAAVPAGGPAHRRSDRRCCWP